jgi:alkaline phosphatase
MRVPRQIPFLLALLLAVPSGADSLILFIGDGMGLEHMKLAQDAAGAPWTGFPHFAAVDPSSLCGIPDSPASGTAIATGHRTANRRIGMLEDGRAAASLAERARGMGFAVGIVTNDLLTGATPAAFYAHWGDRRDHKAIAAFLFRSGLDLFIGGGGRHLPRREARRAGYDYRTSLGPPLGPKALVVLDGGEMPFLMDDPVNGRLLPAVQAALDRLWGDGRPFFLMVESALIDHASHDNDAARLEVEMRGNVRTILSYLQEWVGRHPETALVATADHECGGFDAGARAFTDDHHTAEPVAVLSTRPLSGEMVQQWELHGCLLEILRARTPR